MGWEQAWFSRRPVYIAFLSAMVQLPSPTCMQTGASKSRTSNHLFRTKLRDTTPLFSAGDKDVCICCTHFLQSVAVDEVVRALLLSQPVSLRMMRAKLLCFVPPSTDLIVWLQLALCLFSILYPARVVHDITNLYLPTPAPPSSDRCKLRLLVDGVRCLQQEPGCEGWKMLTKLGGWLAEALSPTRSAHFQLRTRNNTNTCWKSDISEPIGSSD